MNNAHYYLVMDAIRVPIVAQWCAENDIEYGRLYVDTIWKAQMDNSPLWIPVRDGDAIWQQWQTDKQWASSGVLFKFATTMSQDDILSSLKQHITIESEDGRLLFFRFYSPKTLMRVLPHFDPIQISTLCGLASELRFSPLIQGHDNVSPLTNPSDSPTLRVLTISQTLAEDLLS